MTVSTRRVEKYAEQLLQIQSQPRDKDFPFAEAGTSAPPQA